MFVQIDKCLLNQGINSQRVQNQAIILPFVSLNMRLDCFVSEDTYINFWLVMSHSHMQLGIQILKL